MPDPIELQRELVVILVLLNKAHQSFETGDSGGFVFLCEAKRKVNTLAENSKI